MLVDHLAALSVLLISTGVIVLSGLGARVAAGRWW